MIYFDTNYILKCYLQEPGAVEVRELFEENAGQIACARLGRLEMHTTLRRKLLSGNLSPQDVEKI